MADFRPFEEWQKEIEADKLDTMKGRREYRRLGIEKLRAARSAFITTPTDTNEGLKTQVETLATALGYLDKMDEEDALLGMPSLNMQDVANKLSTDGSKDLPTWLVEDLIPENCVSSLAGAGGLGKTYMACQLAAAAAMGCPDLFLDEALADHNTQGIPKRVVYASYELDQRALSYRLNAIADHFPWAEYSQLREYITPLYMPQYEGAGAIWAVPKGEHRARRASLLPLAYDLFDQMTDNDNNIDFLIIDPLGMAFLDDEMNRAVVGEFLVTLQNWCHAESKTMLILSHTTKGAGQADAGDDVEATSGTSAWRGGYRSVLWLRRKKHEGGNGETGKDSQQYNVLVHSKNNFGIMHDPIYLAHPKSAQGAAGGCWTRVDSPEDALIGEGAQPPANNPQKEETTTNARDSRV